MLHFQIYYSPKPLYIDLIHDFIDTTINNTVKMFPWWRQYPRFHYSLLVKPIRSRSKFLSGHSSFDQNYTVFRKVVFCYRTADDQYGKNQNFKGSGVSVDIWNFNKSAKLSIRQADRIIIGKKLIEPCRKCKLFSIHLFNMFRFSIQIQTVSRH